MSSRSSSGAILAPLAVHNLRLLASYGWLAAALLLALMAAVSNPALMGPGEAGFRGECFASLTGLLLFPPLALLDAGGIGETLLAKRHSPTASFLMRWLLTAGFAAVIAAAYFGSLRFLGASFGLPLFCGVLITTLALGSFGMLAAVLFRSLPAGYIAAFAWYLLDWLTKGEWTGRFYLFSMAKGEWNPDKLWLLGLALLSAAISAVLLPRNLTKEAYR